MTRRRQRILIVDDDAFIRKPLEYILRGEGYETQTAVDGDDCMERVEEFDPDLIFLDVMMPGRDGFDVCRLLKQDSRFSHVPIVLLSARGQEHDRARGKALGADAFLTKPYSPTELIARVRAMLDPEEERAACR